MTTQIKILLGLLLAAAAGLYITLFAGNNNPPDHDDPQNSGVENPSDRAKNEVKEIQGDSGKREKQEVAQPKRDLVRKPVTGTSSGAEYEQGVKGVVVDELDNPVADAEVYLMPGMGIEFMRMFREHQKGVRYPPIAQTVTGANGAFELGIETWKEGKDYEVRILHEDYCDHKLPRIVVQPKDWFDKGIIKLKTGVTVFGRVTTETGLPIPDATVAARDGSGTLNITPTPGRETGNTAMTDASGNYELKNLDPLAMVALSAIAENFAKDEKTEIQLFQGGKRHQVDFQLVPGLDIAGFVVDAQGVAVRDATVTVSALSQKSRQVEETTTNTAGEFITSGLKAGVYAVMVKANGFLSADEKPIQAGTKDMNIVLEQQGKVSVTVLGKNDAPVANFLCNLKVAFDGQDTYGNPVVSKNVKGAKNGTVVIEGINPMTYVAEIFADGYAKNFSERFVISESTEEPPRITVRLNEGGYIHGFVRDTKGNPVKGVKIKTMPNGMIENPFTAIFQIPYTISTGNTTTAANGEFSFRMLYPGKYQLKFTHDRFCSDFTKDIVVEVGQQTELGEIKISRGCQVSGIARVDGKASGQIKINVSAVADPKNPIPFSCEAVSDNEGRFLLSKRLKPGKYEYMAAQQVQANPLLMLVQFNKSRKKFYIGENQEHLVLNIHIEKLKEN